MKNKLIIIGYSTIIVAIFYTIIYAGTPGKTNLKTAFSTSYFDSIMPGDLSGENVSGELDWVEATFSEGSISGEAIPTLAESTIEDTIVKDTRESKENKTEKTSQSNNKLTSNTPYYIKVNNAQNVVTIYKRDANGEYTIPYKAMVCSTGEATPSAGNMHKITTYKKRWNFLQGDVYGQYATQIVGNILFHSVPYTDKDNSTLEYWEYDKLGTAASLGCIRLTVADAKWIYDNISSGTIVEFYEDSNPGPLGKPTAVKISGNEMCKNWDPTDPASDNPWNAPMVQPEVINDNVENLTNSGEDLQNSNVL